MPESVAKTETRPSTVDRRCRRCAVGAMLPPIHILWYHDGRIAQWWKCGCGAHNETHLDIEPLPR